MNGSFMKRRRFHLTDMANFNLPPEVLTFSNWDLIQGICLFFLILPLDQLQLNPWISASFTKQSLVSNLMNSVLKKLFNF